MFQPGQTPRTVLLLTAFLFLPTGCFSPLQVAWNGQQPVGGPQVSEGNWALRKVQVCVQDGRTTVVPESRITQAATVSSS